MVIPFTFIMDFFPSLLISEAYSLTELTYFLASSGLMLKNAITLSTFFEH